VNWKGFLARALLVAVSFPVLAALVFLLPHLHHLAFNAAVVLVSAVGSLEMAALFKAGKIPTSTVLAPALAATLPLGTYLEMTGILPSSWLGLWMPAAFGAILFRAVLLTDHKGLQRVLSYSASSFFTFLYPGFFLAWIVRITDLPNPSLAILYFLCLVFGNDMSAYFAGSLWGRSTRLNLPVSPQKSVVGFAAGLAGSLIVVGLFRLLAPGFAPFGAPLDFTLGACAAATVIVGDLLESGLKRSAGVKDSGIVIPGRGGLLDSVDSMLFTAPLFYAFFTLAGR
jgi:phosphatidate cytidylyltransferase